MILVHFMEGAMRYPKYLVAAAGAAGEEVQTIKENHRLAVEPPPPPKPGTAPRAPPRAVPIGAAPSIVPMAPTLPQQPSTPALSLEQEISVLQQFGYSDEDIVDLPADQRTLAANSAMMQGVLPDPALAKPPVSVAMARPGAMAPRPLALFHDELHYRYLGGWHDQAMRRGLHMLRLQSRLSTAIMYFSGFLFSGIGLALLWSI
jgi:hypothetical protein